MADKRNETEFDSEAFIKALWDAVNGEDAREDFRNSYYKDLAGIRTFNEFRNAVIDRTRKDPRYKDAALIELYPDLASEYDDRIDDPGFVYPLFDPTTLKERPLEFEKVPLDEVDAVSEAAARALGYIPDGDATAWAAMKKALIDGKADRRDLVNALKGRLSKTGTPEDDKARRALLLSLGMNPWLDGTDDEAVDRALSYFDRTARAEAANGMNPVGKFVRGFVAPQMSSKIEQGLEPGAGDIAADLALLGLSAVNAPVTLGYRGLRAVAPFALKALGMTAGSEVVDYAHDAFDRSGRRTYETGVNERSEDVGIKQAAEEDEDPRLKNVVTGAALGMGVPALTRGISRTGKSALSRLGLNDTKAGKETAKGLESLGMSKERDALNEEIRKAIEKKENLATDFAKEIADKETEIRRAKSRKTAAGTKRKKAEELLGLDDAERQMKGGGTNKGLVEWEIEKGYTKPEDAERRLAELNSNTNKVKGDRDKYGGKIAEEQKRIDRLNAEIESAKAKAPEQERLLQEEIDRLQEELANLPEGTPKTVKDVLRDRLRELATLGGRIASNKLYYDRNASPYVADFLNYMRSDE